MAHNSFNHEQIAMHLQRRETRLDLVMLGVVLVLGLVFGPPLLNGRPVIGEGLDAVLGLAELVVGGTLEKLVSFGVSFIVDSVLPWLGVRIAAPRHVGVLGSQTYRVEKGEAHAESEGAGEWDQRVMLLQRRPPQRFRPQTTHLRLVSLVKFIF